MLLLAVMLVLSACAGSNKGPEGNAGGSKEQAGEKQTDATQTEQKPDEITIFSYDRTDLANDRVLQEIERKTHTKITIKSGPWDPEQLNIMMVSGDYPDIITIVDNDEFDRMAQWQREGVLVPFDSKLLEGNPSLQALLGEPTFEDLKIDGEHYGIPMRDEPPLGSAGQFVFQIRQDWLNAMGLPMPVTTDDFFNTLMKFKTEDPDKNGKADTYGLITNGVDRLVEYSVGFWGLPHDERSTGFLQVGDNYEYWAIQPEAKEAIKWVKQLHDNGLIHPDTLTQRVITQTRPIFAEGRIGVTVENMNWDQLVNRNRDLQVNAPDGKVVHMPALKGHDGAYGYSKGNGHWAYTVITKKAKNPRAAARLLDFLISEEGTRLSLVGIEGVHYTMDGDKLAWNEEEKAKDPGFNPNTSGVFHELNWGIVRWSPMINEFYIMASEITNPEYGAIVHDNLARVNAHLLDPAAYNVSTSEWSNFMGTGKTLQSEYFTRMVVGELEIEAGFAEFVQAWKSAGGEEAMQTMSDAIKAAQ
ncbi:ABC transporter substrate-binding protein [Paenibacillus sp. 598K]|nr:ABC transporter substrate-binding protein [Paenibacillus sp. 598K]